MPKKLAVEASMTAYNTGQNVGSPRAYNSDNIDSCIPACYTGDIEVSMTTYNTGHIVAFTPEYKTSQRDPSIPVYITDYIVL
jgi:hypothetical protein